MSRNEKAQSATTGGLTISPAARSGDRGGPGSGRNLGRRSPRRGAVRRGRRPGCHGNSVAAFVLVRLIAFFTNVAFFHRWSFAEVSPAQNTLGLWVIVVPIVGGLIVGLMARFGSKAIRGTAFPETMEQVLVHHSRIPARLTFLKPLSAAISIGTGGPFGAEGPDHRDGRRVRLALRAAHFDDAGRATRRCWPRERRPA